MRAAFPAGVCALLAALACSHEREPSFVGTLERDRIELIAEASEPIIERPVAEGQDVAAGDLVVRLDATRLDAQVAQAESRRVSAIARETGATSALANAERELKRVQKLYSNGVAAPDALDRARTLRDQALADRDSARAAVAEAEATIAETRVRASRLTVRAPRAAHVDALPYQLGERPPVGAVVAVLLADDAPYARVYVPEEIRAQVVPGSRAVVRIDGVAGEFSGRVRTVSNEAAFTPYYALTERDRGRLSYLTKIDLEGDAARALPTGLPLEAELARDGAHE
jgi:HlyD family secretion protein